MDLDEPVWSEEPEPDSQENLYINEIPRLTTPLNQPSPQAGQGVPVALLPQPNQGVPATPPLQPDQIEIPPNYELIELDIPEDIVSFNARTQDVLNYQW